MSEDRKFYLELVLALFVIASFVVSIRSCIIAKDAQDTSVNAVEMSKQQFIQTNGPYVILTPKMFKNEKYWRISQHGNKIEIAIQCEIKNVGNVAAKGISKEPIMTIEGESTNGRADVNIDDRTSIITLAPGDSVVLKMKFKLSNENEETAQKNMRYFKSEKSTGMTINIPVTYLNELDETKRYRTNTTFQINEKGAELLKLETMEQIEKENG